MKNIVYFDHELNELLLVNEENDVNSIWIGIKTDANTNQKLTVTGAGTTVEYSLASRSDTLTEIPAELWTLPGSTTFRLSNSGFTSAEASITFPEIINTDSSLYAEDTLSYAMQGSFNVRDNIEDLWGEVNGLEANQLRYILPVEESVDPIADGADNDILVFKFNVQQQGMKMSFYSCLNYTIETTVDTSTDTYGDCTLTISFDLDGEVIAIMDETYGDGIKMLMLNYLLKNLDIGNHIFTINFALSGGSLS